MPEAKKIPVASVDGTCLPGGYARVADAGGDGRADYALRGDANGDGYFDEAIVYSKNYEHVAQPYAARVQAATAGNIPVESLNALLSRVSLTTDATLESLKTALMTDVQSITCKSTHTEDETVLDVQWKNSVGAVQNLKLILPPSNNPEMIVKVAAETVGANGCEELAAHVRDSASLLRIATLLLEGATLPRISPFPPGKIPDDAAGISIPASDAHPLLSDFLGYLSPAGTGSTTVIRRGKKDDVTVIEASIAADGEGTSPLIARLLIRQTATSPLLSATIGSLENRIQISGAASIQKLVLAMLAAAV